MPDWLHIDIPTFDREVAVEEADPAVLVDRFVLERLPFKFETKEQYLRWRAGLATGLRVDNRDVAVVGSACTGRSLSPTKRFGVFKDAKSDVDIAVVSQWHFDEAWQWFITQDPLRITGLDQEGRKTFEQHKKQYIFDGMIASNVFLSYLRFGPEWLRELQRSEANLPRILMGRILTTRIYRTNSDLRRAQAVSLASYRSYLANRNASPTSGDGRERSKLP